MSAAEVIAIIESLPLQEQQRVRDYMQRKRVAVNPDGVLRMGLNKAKAIGEGVFDRHSELFRRLAQ